MSVLLLRVYIVLDGRDWASAADISHELGATPHQVAAALRTLAALGLVQSTPRTKRNGSRVPTAYRRQDAISPNGGNVTDHNVRANHPPNQDHRLEQS